MKKITLLKTLFTICSVCSSFSYASENYIQTQYYELPAGIDKLNCQLEVQFSNGAILGPLPVTIENKPTYTDNAVVEYLCGKTTCQWLRTTIEDCDQHAVLVNPQSVSTTNFSYDFTHNKYMATPDSVLFKFQIETT